MLNAGRAVVVDLSRLSGNMGRDAVLTLAVSGFRTKSPQGLRQPLIETTLLCFRCASALACDGLASRFTRSELPSVRSHGAVPDLHHGRGPSSNTGYSRVDGTTTAWPITALSISWPVCTSGNGRALIQCNALSDALTVDGRQPASQSTGLLRNRRPVAYRWSSRVDPNCFADTGTQNDELPGAHGVLVSGVRGRAGSAGGISHLRQLSFVCNV